MNSVLPDPDFINNFYKFHPELLSNFPKSLNQDLLLQTLSSDEANDRSSSSITQEIPDFPDDCLKFISDILLEEDLTESPKSTQEFSALEATEKALYHAIGLGDSYHSPDRSSSNTSDSTIQDLNFSSFPQLGDMNRSLPELGRSEKIQKRVNKKKKTRPRDSEGVEGRNHKLQACFNDEYIEMEEYDDVILLCNNENRDNFYLHSHGNGRKGRRRKQQQSNSSIDEEIDLMTLLTHCAQAVSSFDLRTASELLKKIRQHASPYGDSTQRLAHHVANALEARLAGTGSTVSANLVDAKFSASDFLKAYRLYVSAIPFKRMSFFLANSMISKLAENANAQKIHIIDFGVFLGLQWPCLIQRLSKRAAGPPQLRITGIDYPQQGFRPAQMVEATGHRLSGYCKRFGVPFKYHGIAQKWETIQPEDLNIEKDELVIVNCMFRSGTLLDETVEAKSQRDGFLALVKRLNPRLFIHGVVNGTFNAPFFLTRFKEALFHYSSVFDVFEETIQREARERSLIESEIYGKELLNVVACEGAERVQRPETYKQWQVKTVRAGMRQVGLDPELVEKAKEMVMANYHRDFMVDVDRHWMLQGWKGRIFCALSFWQPAS